MPKKLKTFLTSKSMPGILLCLATVLALLMENTPFNQFYDLFKSLPVAIQIGDFAIDKPLLLWINDGLMAIFFLLIGLEIKREVHQGHLSDRSQIALPAIAAFGGLALPALIYAMVNLQTAATTMDGWAIPAATDIAFALGVLVLLGSRIPVGLKVCLTALAIFDDLAAIIIIAIFYTDNMSFVALGLAFAGLAFAFLLNRRGETHLGPYMIIGLFIWACVLKSGVHATLAGVALGLLIPIKTENKYGQSPLITAEKALHPWVVLGIIPIFAFVNAGVSLSGITLETFLNPITLGIMLGLFVGKQVGVMGFAYLAVLMKLCKLPENVNWKQFYGLALLSGIGFTMSLFIGTLAFDDIERLEAVRLGVLSGSLLSGVAGVIVLLLTTKKPSHPVVSMNG